MAKIQLEKSKYERISRSKIESTVRGTLSIVISMVIQQSMPLFNFCLEDNRAWGMLHHSWVGSACAKIVQWFVHCQNLTHCGLQCWGTT
ncbi:unnamed protein product [Durusdinium trenchii]|uniref:Uncharacterized protein n=1 Tax=Durusdinium trenchii TaxID=1381693 RepID=A0ABP0SRG7_9DINO